MCDEHAAPPFDLTQARTRALQPERTALEVWVGVETHRDVNAAAALDERGRKLGELAVPTTAAGNSALLACARSSAARSVASPSKAPAATARV